MSILAVIADTHLPRGNRRLPERCVELIAAAEAVIHAGDISTIAALRELEAIGPPVHAIHGNIDERALQRSLPAELVLELDGNRLAIVHDAGERRRRLQRLARRFPGCDAVIFGHSHMPEHLERDGFQIFNPGSPTERRRAPSRSMGLMRTGPGGLEFQRVDLE